MAKDLYTITETYQLPSKGVLYPKCPERLTLRTMTTEEEMRRQSHSDTPYKALCSIVDSCITDEIDISTYDMCLGDYQFLLYKLRTVTHGSHYMNVTPCPFCGKLTTSTIDLDTLKVKTLDGFNLADFQEVKLPRSGVTITIIPRTPRILEETDLDKTAFLKRFPENTIDVSMLFKLKHAITLVDGQHYDALKLENFIRKLPAMDANILDNAIDKLDNLIGVDTALITKCTNPLCGLEYGSSFRITSEFFRPTLH